MKTMKLTPSRKAKLIVFKVLEYAEAGGMAPQHCGMTYEALSNCLDGVGNKPDEALASLIDQIDTIIKATVWRTE